MQIDEEIKLDNPKVKVLLTQLGSYLSITVTGVGDPSARTLNYASDKMTFEELSLAVKYCNRSFIAKKYFWENKNRQFYSRLLSQTQALELLTSEDLEQIDKFFKKYALELKAQREEELK